MPLIGGTTANTWTAEAAFRFCERLAKTHYENFTVGSWLLPKEKRRHVYTIYAFCRTVDDLGDEATPDANPGANPARGGLTEFPPAGSTGPLPFLGEEGLEAGGDAYRLALLDWWQSELDACYAGTPTHPVMVALQETISTFDIPSDPFHKLIEANRMDQCSKRYSSHLARGTSAAHRSRGPPSPTPLRGAGACRPTRSMSWHCTTRHSPPDGRP